MTRHGMARHKSATAVGLCSSVGSWGRHLEAGQHRLQARGRDGPHLRLVQRQRHQRLDTDVQASSNQHMQNSNSAPYWADGIRAPGSRHAPSSKSQHMQRGIDLQISHNMRHLATRGQDMLVSGVTPAKMFPAAAESHHRLEACCQGSEPLTSNVQIAAVF